MDQLTHLDSDGNANMVNVGSKPVTAREAVAVASIHMQPDTLSMILQGGHKKGDVLATARIAGIQAAKRTWELIPLCHQLPLDRVKVDLIPVEAHHRIDIIATCNTHAKTGVEMEALTAASVAALTLYDMCKGVDRSMAIQSVSVRRKTGGQSGTWQA